jgi:hypothetical protein
MEPPGGQPGPLGRVGDAADLDEDVPAGVLGGRGEELGQRDAVGGRRLQGLGIQSKRGGRRDARESEEGDGEPGNPSHHGCHPGRETQRSRRRADDTENRGKSA